MSREMRYIYISKTHNEFLSEMIDRGSLKKKEDGLKLGVALALAFDPDGTISKSDEAQLNRKAGALNLNSADVDEDQSITGIMSAITNDKTKNNYKRMMELTFIGLELLSKKYIDDDKLINWELIQKDIK